MKDFSIEVIPKLLNKIQVWENKNDHIDYVLGDFSKNEESIALKSIENAYLCILEIINNGFVKAMEKFN